MDILNQALNTVTINTNNIAIFLYEYALHFGAKHYQIVL